MNRCIVVRIALEDHPTAPHLQVGRIGPHTVVVGRHYDEGTLGFYIPVGAIVPDKLLEEMWLKGKLAGSKKNRVKGREMHGVQSEGLFYGSRYYEEIEGQRRYIDTASWNPNWVEGQDITDEVGVVCEE